MKPRTRITPITRITRRKALFCAVSALGLPGAAWPQAVYPSRPITILSPNAPGGLTSVLARMMGEQLTKSWGQPVVVDSRAGGNGIIGGRALQHAAPDGYTLMSIFNTHNLVPLLTPAPYDPINDFTPIATLCATEFALVIHPSVPANNLDEFVALAKAKPGQLNFASSGTGAMPHLAAELFSMLRGIKMQHLPYKGSAPAITDLLGGQVQLFFSPVKDAIPYVKAGRFRALAVSGDKRSPALSDVPTFAEAGVTDFQIRTWAGIIGPAGLPKEIVARLSGEIARILRTPEVRDKLETQGLEVLISTPEQFTALMKSDTVRFSGVIKSANIKLDT